MADRVGSLETSSSTLASIIYDEALNHISGQYFDRGLQPSLSSPLSYNKENAQALFRKSVEYTKLDSTMTLKGILD
ncbi:hypothetical protein AOC36_03860 [Erysipelothrix larvae]|uniref:Uncharacterized protein n=1 Tax=Erysipelothrix larvae TaxID=1514105 RepID=A0A109UGS6_9FIRM|nr:hypothetical protein [Erysipelothrix larvae]AMC93137.1 hypothetical protein AOC36_03860 [Erysipelothrix larvae]